MEYLWGVFLPKTGEANEYLIFGFVVLFFLGGLALVLSRNKSQKKDD